VITYLFIPTLTAAQISGRSQEREGKADHGKYTMIRDAPKFKKYSSLDHLTSRGLLPVTFDPSNNSIDWVATEKIHGCNFAFYLDGAGELLSCASRSKFLHDTDIFFHGWKEMRERYRDSLRALGERLGNGAGRSGGMIVYGELFGGKVKPVQKGINYTIEKEFYLFDLYHCGDECYLSYDEVMEAAQECAFPYRAEAVLRGPLETVMRFDVSNFNTRLNFISRNDQLAEGVIIRPVVELKNPTGHRKLFKKKCSRWSENTKRKYPISIKDGFDEDTIKMLDSITLNRAHAVASKSGWGEEYRVILDAFVDDVLEERGKSREDVGKKQHRLLCQASSHLLYPLWKVENQNR